MNDVKLILSGASESDIFSSLRERFASAVLVTHDPVILGSDIPAQKKPEVVYNHSEENEDKEDEVQFAESSKHIKRES